MQYIKKITVSNLKVRNLERTAILIGDIFMKGYAMVRI
jgi:hypothetical protein